MSRFRRAAFGSTYFFTVISHRRRPILCDDRIRQSLRDAIQAVRVRRPFEIDGFVLLPDHLHCIWTLPDGDHDYSTRWSLIKHHVAYACRDMYPDGAATRSRQRHRDGAIWQRRFWEHTIRSDIDMERHMDYVHFNPVRHGHAASAWEWQYSTFRRYVRDGVYPADWAGLPHLQSLDYE
jgi:putative transposase